MRKMKDSGVSWVGSMPEHWEIVNPKSLFSLRKDKAIPGQRQLTASQQYGVIYQDEYMMRTGSKVVVVEKDFDILKQVISGDFVISMRSFQGGIEYSTYDGSISSAYIMLIPDGKKVHHAFYKWLLKSSGYISALQSTSNLIRDGQAMRYSNFAKVPLPSLPMKEQQAIANFLDSKCAEIDALMEDIRAEISTLEEYKKSVITEAVTKGLNPDAEMKDSGIAWVGEIPRHWEIVNPKSLFTLRKDKAFSGQRQLTASQQYGVIYQDEYMNLTGNKVVIVEKDFDILKQVKAGDFVISMRSFQGGLEYSPYDGSISSAYNMLIPNTARVHNSYYKWLLKSPGYIRALQSTSNLIRDGQAMRYSNFAKVPLPSLPLKEQQTIADYLDPKCAEIEATIAEKQKQLTILEEYKKSLIYEYVTGKKEVP